MEDDDEDSDSDEESEDEASTIPNIQGAIDSFCYYFGIPSSCLKSRELIFFLYIFDKQVRRVAHHGCVNRIRAMPHNPHICVSWADSGHVQGRDGDFRTSFDLTLAHVIVFLGLWMKGFLTKARKYMYWP